MTVGFPQKVQAVGRMGEFARDFIDLLVQYLNNEEDNLVVAAINSLGELGHLAVGAVPALVLMAASQNNDVAEEAKFALKRIRRY